MKHHPLSMSNWVKWELCPCATPTPGASSSAAESGTRSHAFLSLLVGGVDDPKVDGITADERGRAEWAFDVLADLADGSEIHSETKVEIAAANLPGGPKVAEGSRLVGISGTCDAWFVRDNVLHVCDYKTYAMGDADYSAQTGGYALALATSAGLGCLDGYALHTLNGGSRTVDTVRGFDFGELVERSEAIIDVHAEKGEDLELACCNRYCKYCGRANTCPAADRALTVVRSGGVFQALSLAKQMVIVKEVKAICERVEKDAKAELDRLVEAAGGDIGAACLTDGEVTWRYKERAGAGVLDDIVGLAEAVAERGVSSAELMGICKVSKTAVCDKLIASNPGMKAAEAKRVIAPFYVSGKPSRTLERVK